MGNHHAIPTTARCPCCDAELNAAMGTDDAGIPGPGSLTFCVYCGTAAVFTDDMMLRTATPAEIEQFDPRTIIGR